LPMFDGEDLKRFIAKTTWLTVNDYEWELIADRTGYDKQSVSRQVQALVVTKGGEGSEIHADGKQFHIPAARPAKTLDPTGCGDAYRAGLLYGLTNDMDWETTGRIASLMGSIKIEHHGTQNHHLDRGEFATRFKEAFGRDI